ncbi:MAG: YjgP/YjgQ family permease [Candidatus Eisenbacteria bacterium]|nr:YjgP/YjgQ family permease [Candidatus Eisenbacteria bacterium]
MRRLHTEVRLTSRRLVPLGILSRYVARQLWRPFLLGFAVVTFLLTLELLLDYLDLFLGKGISLLIVGKLFLLGLGWMIALSVPCGVLVAVLMAYGQMSQDNEITAMRASGINLVATMLPTLFLASLVAILLALFNNFILPDTNHAFANIVGEIQRTRPSAEIQEGIFIDDFEGYDLFVGKLDDRSGEMSDVLIVDTSDSGAGPRTIRARHGLLSFVAERNEVVLSLRDGEIHEADPHAKDGRYRRLVFGEQTMHLAGATEALARAVRRSRGQREMSVGDMKREIETLEKDYRRSRADVDSSLARLGVASPEELPPIDEAEMRPRGARRILAGALALIAGRGKTDAPPEISAAKRRQIEELKIKLLQAKGIRKQIDSFRVEIQKKFSIPVACVVFVLIGAPLGMRARRGGLAAGFLSVVFFLFYWACLIGGEQLADRGLAPPWLAMWFANLLLGPLGIYLTLRIATTGPPQPAARRRRA